MKTILLVLLVLFVTFPIWLAIWGMLKGLFIEPIKDIIKNGKNAETKISTLFKRFILLAVIIFLILWIPWIVSTNGGETTCRNLLGFTMKC